MHPHPIPPFWTPPHTIVISFVPIPIPFPNPYPWYWLFPHSGRITSTFVPVTAVLPPYSRCLYPHAALWCGSLSALGRAADKSRRCIYIYTSVIRDGNGSVGHGSLPLTHWPMFIKLLRSSVHFFVLSCPMRRGNDYGSWVMGQLCYGSHGSWVTKDDPFPSLSVMIPTSSCNR